MIKIKNLTFRYENEYIFKDFNLNIKKGEILGVMGNSGSGKTTLLRLICGLENVENGKIYINDVDVTNVPSYKRNVGLIFQDFALFPHLSVKKNILFGISHKARKYKIEKLNYISKLFEIDDYLNRYPNELSHGQKQRVAIARAIVCEPSILLFDEPFSSLDSEIKSKMRNDIKNILNKIDITSVIVSHDKEDLNLICNRQISI